MAVRARIAHLDNWLMDAEHGQMLHLIENLESVLSSGKDELAIRTGFDRLITWTAKHFAHENDHMLQTKFKSAAEHIAHHQQLIETLKGFVRDAENGSQEKIRVADALQFLEDWLVVHIETDDTKLAQFLDSKGTRWVSED